MIIGFLSQNVRQIASFALCLGKIRLLQRVNSMKIFRKFFRNKKKRHAANKKRSRKTTSKKRVVSRTYDAHLLKDDFLFGTGHSSSKRYRRKHKVRIKMNTDVNITNP